MAQIDPRLPAIPTPTADPASHGAVLLALKQRIEALSACIVTLMAKLGT